MIKKNKHILKLGILLCVVMGYFSSAQKESAEAAVLTLKDLVKWSVEASPVVMMMEQQKKSSALEILNAQVQLLPSLDLNAVHGVMDSRPSRRSESEPYTSRLTLSLRENLYDNGETFNLIKRNKIQNQIDEVQWRLKREEITRDIVVNFLSLSLNKKLQQIQQKNQNLLEKQLQAEENLYRQGLRTRRDYLRLKSQVGRSRMQLFDNEENIRKNEIELKKNLHPDVWQKWQDSQLRNQSVEDAQSFLAKEINQQIIPVEKPPLEEILELKEYFLRQELAQLNTQLVKRKYWPEVFLTGEVSYQTYDYLGTGLRPGEEKLTSGNALLTLKFNLWDWGTRRRNVQVAQNKEKISELEQRSKRLELRESLEKLLVEMQIGLSSFKSSEELLQLEKNNFDFLRYEYSQGRISFLDYINGLSNYLEAETKFISLQNKLKQSLVSYKYYQGELYNFVMGAHSL